MSLLSHTGDIGDGRDGFFFRNSHITLPGIVDSPLNGTLSNIQRLCNLTDGHSLFLHLEDGDQLIGYFSSFKAFPFFSRTWEIAHIAPHTTVMSKAIETPKATAGIGYVKTAQPYANEKTFTVEKTSEGTSWGAVYAQFLQPTATIADQQSGIKVTRELRTSDKSKVTSDKYSNSQEHATRQEQINQIASGYVKELERVVRLYPTQWYNYFDFWKQ